jgi:hypothetical protein
MKNITLIIAGLLLAGCANLSVVTPTWRMHAQSLFKDINVPKVSAVTPDMNIQVEGYQSACNLVELQKVTDSVVSMIIKAGMNAVTK